MNNSNTLLTLFEEFASTQSYAEALNDFIDYFLLGFRLHETNEEQQKALETMASHPKRQQLTAMFVEVGELAEGFNDPVGYLFESLIAKDKQGQFFTPHPVAGLLAELAQIGNSEERDTVLDPACGSGRLLLAAAKRNRYQRFYGADTDPLCCKMALMNMLLQSLTGEIAHMNSLSNEFFQGYRVHTVLKNGYHLPYYVPFADPEQSRIWLHPRPTPSQGFSSPLEPTMQPSGAGVQGSLFNV